jgi:hypothetical protein
MGNLQQNRLIMNLKTALLFTAIFSLVACNTKDKNKSALEGTQKKASSQAFEFSTWITSDQEIPKHYSTRNGML